MEKLCRKPLTVKGPESHNQKCQTREWATSRRRTRIITPSYQEN